MLGQLTIKLAGMTGKYLLSKRYIIRLPLETLGSLEANQNLSTATKVHRRLFMTLFYHLHGVIRHYFDCC